MCIRDRSTGKFRCALSEIANFCDSSAMSSLYVNEEQLIYYVLGFLSVCLCGLPGLAFSTGAFNSFELLTNSVFTAVVAVAAYGWISICISTRFLKKADKANTLLVVGGGSLAISYFICSFMLKEYTVRQQAPALDWL
eukprot:TRINITY_DN4270_c0_g2_i1.p1 TRINITY_DN4270_c0_g2~~TRINITY_DN4270_c0_g2_i1.p1  ORF type:complete len:138 (+),score=15.78 TRINITY_DN4270_c0_g2_i1:38-451(+)